MKPAELFSLREKKWLQKLPIAELRSKLEDLFGQQYLFPLVAGYKEQGKENWKVSELPPQTNADKLTVQNYLEGIRSLEQSEQVSKFLAYLIFKGVERPQREEGGSDLLTVGIQAAPHGSTLTQDFKLHLNLSPDYGHYCAVSQLSPTGLEQNCARFVGPNILK